MSLKAIESISKSLCSVMVMTVDSLPQVVENLNRTVIFLLGVLTLLHELLYKVLSQLEALGKE